MRLFRHTSRLLPTASIAALVTSLLGCSSDILNVRTPNIIREGSLQSPQGITSLRNGSMMDFIVGFSGTIDSYVMSSGTLGDEFLSTDSFADRYSTDGRYASELLGGAINTPYGDLHKARAGLGSVIKLWSAGKGSSAAAKDSLGEMYAVRGYSEMLFGEGFCSGVPFSDVLDNGDFDYGQPLTTAQMFAVASASLDTALANASSDRVRNLAAIGKGRVLVNMGQYGQAAAAVKAVPTSYKYLLGHSAGTNRQYNGIWSATFVASSRYNVVTSEGVNGIGYLTTPADPRVPWVPSTRTGFDNASKDLPTQMKYPSQAAPITLADGIEARLIEAEAALGGSTSSQAGRDAMISILNNLRATGLSTAIVPLQSPVSHDAAVDVLFKERALWMWLTGHRLGDMRRLVRQYGRTANTVFPVGAISNRPGNTYGTQTSLVIPVRERNNPNFKGCQD